MAKTQLAVTLYMETQTLTGFICHKEERLSDLLNAVSVKRENRGRFVELSYVAIQYTDGREEKLATAYINKATIQVATTIDGNLAKGIGGKVGAKRYPFVEKLPVPVRVRMPAYILMGNMHCASGQMAWHALEEKMFLPLSNVSICRSDNSHWWKVPFAAVNREQMLSLAELE
ncbi:unnamed protein product [marine sediment metagenome]|uniref:Uncharacterized protein n=1 Tax=marine sediment metagenome TaxID=412755 RepID=X1P5M5_9ZZZZ